MGFYIFFRCSVLTFLLRACVHVCTAFARFVWASVTCSEWKPFMRVLAHVEFSLAFLLSADGGSAQLRQGHEPIRCIPPKPCIMSSVVRTACHDNGLGSVCFCM